MGESAERTELHYSISQSAAALQVSDKTIRNYIDRGIVRAEKWNGSWKISHGNLSALFRKKYGKPMDMVSGDVPRPTAPGQETIQIARIEYNQLLRRAGRADAAEELAAELRNDIRAQADRIAQLEASSASGWTEARRHKQDIDGLALEMVERKEREEELKRQCDRQRAELDRWLVLHDERGAELSEALEENKKLVSALDECEDDRREGRTQLKRLQERYRRDGFVD